MGELAWQRGGKTEFFLQRQQSILKFNLFKSLKPFERDVSLQGGEDSGAGQR